MRMDSSDEALEYLAYRTLEHRREGHVLKLVKKCLNNRCPQFLIDYFKVFLEANLVILAYFKKKA